MVTKKTDNMFGLFKKRLNAKKRAYLIASTLSDYIDGLDEVVDKFLQEHPTYGDKRNNIIAELQWIIATGGIISIKILSDNKKAKKTYEQLIEFYRILHKSNNNSSAFNDNYLSELEAKFENYLVRFNRGIGLRDNTINSYDEALIDVANESMKYFIGEIRQSKILDYDDLFKLQKDQNQTN